MVESIKQFGILIPIITRLKNEEYITLSGHNRVNAAKIIGLKKVPVIIKENITDDEAMLIVTETNLRQRAFSDLSHSERIHCITQHYNAIKSQGKRNDLLLEIDELLNHENTSVGIPHKLKSRDRVGREYNLSADKITRYIKLSALIQPFIDLLDSTKLPFYAAYNLSFIDGDTQQIIFTILESNNIKLTLKKSEELRFKYDKNCCLTEDKIIEIILGNPNNNTSSNLDFYAVLKKKNLNKIMKKYFTTANTTEEIERIIDLALEQYFML